MSMQFDRVYQCYQVGCVLRQAFGDVAFLEENLRQGQRMILGGKSSTSSTSCISDDTNPCVIDPPPLAIDRNLQTQGYPLQSEL